MRQLEDVILMIESLEKRIEKIERRLGPLFQRTPNFIPRWNPRCLKCGQEIRTNHADICPMRPGRARA